MSAIQENLQQRQEEMKVDGEVSDNSDAELEAALQVEQDVIEPARSQPLPEIPSQSQPQLHQTPQSQTHNHVNPSTLLSGLSSGSSSTTFKIPPNPHIPQDLHLIMEMVSKNEVVGSLPPISMSANDKRKLVEESLKNGFEVGSERKEKEISQEEHSDSDSSSSFVSSSEEESDSEDEDKKTSSQNDKPMSKEKHQEMKKELNEFMGIQSSSSSTNQPESQLNENYNGEGGISLRKLNEMGLEFMEDSEFEEDEDDEDEDEIFIDIDEDVDEDGGKLPSGPITSIHETPLPVVPQPPLTQLPKNENLSLAGDVVSWMKDKKVELWLEKKKLEEEQAIKESKGEEGVIVNDEMQDNDTTSTRDSTETAKQEMEKEDAKPDAIEIKENPVDSDAKGEIDVRQEIKEEEGEIPEGEISEKPANLPENTVALQTTTGKTKATSQEPKFTSSGTVVVRAMQSRPGDIDEGWLEEGSVLCWEDGRVLGVVHETFGPLTSPFYTIRLPPPPFPYPSSESLIIGTKLYYCLNNNYKSFVNMLKVRDPKFKGSDASNIYDEEIDENEIEFSDDELELQSKQSKKKNKQKQKNKNNNNNNKEQRDFKTSKSKIPGLPNRPHFDYHPDQDMNFNQPDTGSLYGGDTELVPDIDINNEDWEKMSDFGGSGSTISTRSIRNLPEPYDINIDDEPISNNQRERGGGSNNPRGGNNGRGRSQGRDRGRGRGGRGGGANNRGGHGQQAHQRRESNSSNKNNSHPHQGFALPMNPMLTQQQILPQQPFVQYNNLQQQHQMMQQQQYYPQQNHSYQQQQQQNNFPQFQQQGYPPMQMQMPFQYQHQHQHQQQQQTQLYNTFNGNNDSYEPNQPQTGMPSYNNQQQSSNYPQYNQYSQQQRNYPQPSHQNLIQQSQQNYSQSQQPTTGSAGVPAINPRFAAQYSQMMNNQSSQGQGQNYEYGWQGQGGNHYSE
ncbi:uncharacterized protein L201_008028 [Kwoniella dendrophila CBS 6074]|uniref:H/ACA ribonucleoprotein complex non-core subunit NAF1 n=1 Tax=Kwoniella dendrophila CBS 6074 TaxID=1295534 RepID=A0AAX4K7J6_9TREE